MTSLSNSYINALMADASYVSFASNLGELKPIPEILTAIARRLTQPQAEYLLTNFQILVQEQSPNGGFDAVVWRGKDGTQYAGKSYLSIRGTQELHDFDDDADLAKSGLAHQQLVSMVNWWLRETTAQGSNAVQIGIQTIGIPGETILLQNFVQVASTLGTQVPH